MQGDKPNRLKFLGWTFPVSLAFQVEVVNCLKVGRKVDGKLVPWSNSPQDVQNFIGARENLPKHCVEDLSWVPYSKAGTRSEGFGFW